MCGLSPWKFRTYKVFVVYITHALSSDCTFQVGAAKSHPVDVVSSWYVQTLQILGLISVPVPRYDCRDRKAGSRRRDLLPCCSSLLWPFILFTAPDNNVAGIHYKVGSVCLSW